MHCRRDKPIVKKDHEIHARTTKNIGRDRVVHRPIIKLVHVVEIKERAGLGISLSPPPPLLHGDSHLVVYSSLPQK